jgi:hypothetical protein
MDTGEKEAAGSKRKERPYVYLREWTDRWHDRLMWITGVIFIFFFVVVAIATGFSG